MSLNEYLSKSSTQAIIAIIIIFGGILFLAYVPATEVIKTNISNMMLVVLGFYFGASKGNSDQNRVN
jgi:Trk-type K+ transport system membrane component